MTGRTSLFQLIAVSAVVMGIAQTIAKERIFEPLRDRLGNKETWLGYLVSCPYCASHYLAFALVPITGTYAIEVAVQWGLASRLLTWFLSSYLVVVIAAFMRVAFWYVDETQGLIRRRQRTEDEEHRMRRIAREQLEEERQGIH